MGQRNEVILTQEEIYKRIFTGKPVNTREMFSSIRRFTPTGNPRRMPHNRENVERYNDYVYGRFTRTRQFEKCQAQADKYSKLVTPGLTTASKFLSSKHRRTAS